MVGVPGRSKGCHTCRRRRKGCDLQRPECAQCKRLGLKCDGYERKTTFVHHGAVSVFQLTIAASSTEARKTVKSGKKRNTTVDKVSTIALPEKLAKSAYECSYLALFFEMYQPGSTASSVSDYAGAGGLSLTSWLVGVQCRQIYHGSPLLQKSVMAICLSTLGQRMQNRQMTEEGLKAYTVALRGMSVALTRNNGKLPPDEAMLAATRCLSLYEVFFGTDASNIPGQARAWNRHRFGEMALLSARDPSMHKDGWAHDLLADGRMSCTIAGIVTRKDTMFSREEWKTVPWSGTNRKTAMDLLLDIFVDIPKLLVDLDSLTISPSTTKSKEAEAQSSLLERCEDMLEELEFWLERHAPTKWREVSPRRGRTGYEACHYPCSDNPTADDVAEAHIMCLFWAMQIKVRKVAVFTNFLGSEDESLPPEELEELVPYAQAILQTAPIFLTPGAGIAGCHLSVFPLTCAVRLFMTMSGTGATQVGTYIRELLSNRGRETGLPVWEFVKSLGILSLPKTDPILDGTRLAGCVY
ncbi:hypothetical protein QBC35DRAFT_384646 [Podospora australis]|uniref:Zn(2)-C6 fungal-type domain-containing protein n=1 Tax=Podospora australis TaxID=1536484 RepID=A0AAN6WSH9_9PEZI|nr:hypothetical protein QBC35DRAFT_384646 [Podospora australis]